MDKPTVTKQVTPKPAPCSGDCGKTKDTGGLRWTCGACNLKALAKRTP